MNGHSVSPSDATGRLSRSFPRKTLSAVTWLWRAHSRHRRLHSAPRGAAFPGGPNKLRGSADGAADFAAPLPHRQRAAATSSLDAKVRKCTKKVYFHLLSQGFCVYKLRWPTTVPKTNDLLKTTERSRAEKHPPQWGCAGWPTLPKRTMATITHHQAPSKPTGTHACRKSQPTSAQTLP